MWNHQIECLWMTKWYALQNEVNMEFQSIFSVNFLTDHKLSLLPIMRAIKLISFLLQPNLSLTLKFNIAGIVVKAKAIISFVSYMNRTADLWLSGTRVAIISKRFWTGKSIKRIHSLACWNGFVFHVFELEAKKYDRWMISCTVYCTFGFVWTNTAVNRVHTKQTIWWIIIMCY